MLPWTHPSPNPKWHVHQFSHLCTYHGRVAILYNGPLLFPLNLPLPSGHLDPNLIHGFFGPPDSSTQKASRLLQPFLFIMGRSFHPQNCPLPMGDLDLHVIHDSLGLSEPITRTVSRSVQPFLHISRQNIPIVYNEPAFPRPQNCPFPWGDLDPYLIHGSLSPPVSQTQMASQSVEPFLQGSLL